MNQEFVREVKELIRRGKFGHGFGHSLITASSHSHLRVEALNKILQCREFTLVQVDHDGETEVLLAGDSPEILQGVEAARLVLTGELMNGDSNDRNLENLFFSN